MKKMVTFITVLIMMLTLVACSITDNENVEINNLSEVLNIKISQESILEKKDTENMEMKKPEEQAKPKKKKIISVVRPQNATSKEAKEFTKNQGQKKDRPSRGNGRPEGNRNGNGRSEDRPNRGNGNGGNGDRPNRNGDRPQGERRFNNLSLIHF